MASEWCANTAAYELHLPLTASADLGRAAEQCRQSPEEGESRHRWALHLVDPAEEEGDGIVQWCDVQVAQYLTGLEPSGGFQNGRIGARQDELPPMLLQLPLFGFFVHLPTCRLGCRR